MEFNNLIEEIKKILEKCDENRLQKSVYISRKLSHTLSKLLDIIDQPYHQLTNDNLYKNSKVSLWDITTDIQNLINRLEDGGNRPDLLKKNFETDFNFIIKKIERYKFLFSDHPFNQSNLLILPRAKPSFSEKKNKIFIEPNNEIDNKITHPKKLHFEKKYTKMGVVRNNKNSTELKNKRKGKLIFISYSNEDLKIINELCKRLKNDGYDIWIDQKNIRGGDKWEMIIEDAIEKSDYFIACLSKAAITKRSYIHSEFKKALKKEDQMPEGRIYLIPLKLDDFELPQKFSDLHYLNFFENDGYENLLHSLDSQL